MNRPEREADPRERDASARATQGGLDLRLPGAGLDVAQAGAAATEPDTAPAEPAAAAQSSVSAGDMPGLYEGVMGRRGRRRGRGVLLGCGITLAVLLPLLGAGWWLVSRNLGQLVSGMVKARAGDSLNGRLEFDKLDVDLAGRAVLTNAAVYPSGQSEAVFTCPRIVVTADLINFIGPNRGRRAVVVDLYQPWARIVRGPDGGFNLAKLVKPPKEKRQKIGVSVQLHNAKLDFTDACLLDQSYPTLSAPPGIGERVLRELGYLRSGPGEAVVHTEQVQANGSVVVNPEREEVALDVRVEREAGGGKLSATGTAKSDGTTFDITLALAQVDLLSLADYARALFPALLVTPAAPPAPTGSAAAAEAAAPASGRPELQGRIQSGQVELKRQPAHDVDYSARIELREVAYASRSLPRLSLPHVSAAFGSAPKRAGGEFELELLGCQISGNPRVDFDSGALSGSVTLKKTALAALLGAARDKRLAPSTGTPSLLRHDLPLSGTLGAKLDLGGTLSAPQIVLTPSSDKLAYGKLGLGRLGGVLKLSGTALTAQDVRLSGGDVPLKLAGALDTKAREGRFTLSAGPISVAEALDLAARLGQPGKPAKLDAQGKLTLGAVAQITAGKLTSSLSLQSDKLTLAGQTLTSVSVKGRLAPPSVLIDEATAVLVSKQPVNAAGFSSTGPLKLNLRAGGSIGTSPGSKGAIALSGKAGTQNLAPAQAAVSFKVAGPLSDPEIRAQLKTAQQTSPLIVSATGHYRSGWSPLKADLAWHETKAHFDGRVDFAAQKLDGTLSADALDVGRFSGQRQLSGVLSAKAQLGGTFKAPSVSGRVSAPRLAYTTARRAYQVTELAAAFKLAGTDAVNISEGRFNFESNAFTAQGTLGKQGKEITLGCQRFNLFSALALAPVTAGGAPGKGARPLHVQSAGPLTVVISGGVKDPRAVVEYASGAGAVEGHGFDSARLSATATLDGAQLRRFEIASPQGGINATGSAAFARPGGAPAPQVKPKAGLLGLFRLPRAAAQAPPPPGFSLASWSANVDVHSFDVAVLTPLTGQEALQSLTGKLDGTLRVSGSGKQYSADGALKLTGGRYQGVQLSEASANLQTTGQGIVVKSGRVVAEGTVLNVSGTIANKLAQSELEAHADSLELALVNPFLPEKTPQLKGPVKLDLQLMPDRGDMPAIAAQVHGLGRPIQAGELSVSSVALDLLWRGGETTLKQCDLTLAGSRFSATGTLGKALNEARLKAQSDSIELSLLQPWLPQGMPKLKGAARLSVELSPSKAAYPNIEANIQDSGKGIQVGDAAFDAASVQLSLRDGLLDLHQCSLKAGGSTLTAGGKLGLGDLSPKNGKHDFPLDFWVKASQFGLRALAPLLPAATREKVPGGSVTCDLQLAGRQSQPLLSGDISFNLSELPPALLPVAVTGVSGEVSMVKNDFDIKRVDVKSSEQSGLGQAKITGSGRLSLNPPGMLSGSIDIVLAPQGQFTLVKYYDPTSSSKKAVFEGTLGGMLHVSGSRDAHPVIGGQLVINAPAAVSIVRYEPPDPHRPKEPSNVRLENLKLLVQSGTQFRYSPSAFQTNPIDLEANLSGELTVNGNPGVPAGADALSVAGELAVPKGSMQVYSHVIRLDNESNRLQFSGDPGDLFPYFTGRGALILPHVLTGNEVLAGPGQAGGVTQISAGQDLTVYFNFNRVRLDPASGALDKIQLSSDPPLPPEQIRNLLLGGVEGVLTGQTGLSQFAENEAIGFGTSFISRVIEKQLDLNAFRLGGTGGENNPFYMQMEKQVNPDVSLTYFRNFFSQAGQQEEFGVKYNVFRTGPGQRYQNVDLKLNFQQGGISGNNREFMFTWTTRF